MSSKTKNYSAVGHFRFHVFHFKKLPHFHSPSQAKASKQLCRWAGLPSKIDSNIQQKHHMSTYLAWIWGKEHDIIVDNKSTTGNNKNILFLPDNKYGFVAILAANLMWAVEPVVAKVEMKFSG